MDVERHSWRHTHTFLLAALPRVRGHEWTVESPAPPTVPSYPTNIPKNINRRIDNPENRVTSESQTLGMSNRL